MAWFERVQAPKVKSTDKASVPRGIWRRCEACGMTALEDEFERALQTCPSCGRHFRIGARDRLRAFLDQESMRERAAALEPVDPLEFQDVKPYPDRLRSAQRSAGEQEAFILAEGRLQGVPVIAGAFEFRFLGGSMGSVVGEKVTLAFELAAAMSQPVILFSASGGARMQEGICSLMQMAKTSAAIASFRVCRRPFVSVLTDPTTGGVAASFAMLGDVIIAEPGALVGFAGPRVVEQTIRQQLPEGFQRSEFLLEHGVIDMIVPRPELRARISSVVAMLSGSS